MKTLVVLLFLGVITSAYAAALKIDGTDNALTSTVTQTKKLADFIERSIHVQLASLSTEERERVLTAVKDITAKIGQKDSDEYFMASILTTLISTAVTKIVGMAVTSALGWQRFDKFIGL